MLSRRWKMFVAAALAGVVVLFALVEIARFIGVPPPSGRISDRHHRVVLTLRPGWWVRTTRDAGQMSTQGDSGVQVEPYRVSDIQADRDGPGNHFTYLWVDILPKRNDLSLAARHREAVADQCAIYGCHMNRRTPTVPVDVDGKPAILTVVPQDGHDAVVIIITTRTGSNDVVLAGFTDYRPYAAKGGSLTTVLLSAELD